MRSWLIREVLLLIIVNRTTIFYIGHNINQDVFMKTFEAIATASTLFTKVINASFILIMYWIFYICQRQKCIKHQHCRISTKFHLGTLSSLWGKSGIGSNNIIDFLLHNVNIRSNTFNVIKIYLPKCESIRGYNFRNASQFIIKMCQTEVTSRENLCTKKESWKSCK